MSGDCDFLSANTYARSQFGEDALANLSIEMPEALMTHNTTRCHMNTSEISSVESAAPTALLPSGLLTRSSRE